MDEQLSKLPEREIIANLYAQMLAKADCDVDTYMANKKMPLSFEELRVVAKEKVQSLSQIQFTNDQMTDNDLLSMEGQHPAAGYLFRKVGGLVFIWQESNTHPYVK